MPGEKYKISKYKDTVQAEPVMMYTRYRRGQITEASTRITVRAEQVMMYTKYTLETMPSTSLRRRKLNPVYNLDFTQ